MHSSPQCWVVALNKKGIAAVTFAVFVLVAGFPLIGDRNFRLHPPKNLATAVDVLHGAVLNACFHVRIVAVLGGIGVWLKDDERMLDAHFAIQPLRASGCSPLCLDDPTSRHEEIWMDSKEHPSHLLLERGMHYPSKKREILVVCSSIPFRVLPYNVDIV